MLQILLKKKKKQFNRECLGNLISHRDTEENYYLNKTENPAITAARKYMWLMKTTCFRESLLRKYPLLVLKLLLILFAMEKTILTLITFNTAHWLDYNKFCMKVDPCVMPPLRFGCWSYTL